MDLNYYKVENNIYAGEYPFAKDSSIGLAKICVLRNLCITDIIDLTEEGELIPYNQYLNNISHYRFPIKDRFVPESVESVKLLMEHMREKIDHNRTIYLHCWGGVGRTGTIVACWFVYHGYTFEEALGHLNNLWKECPKSTRRTHCPEYKHQEDFVKHFDNYLHTL